MLLVLLCEDLVDVGLVEIVVDSEFFEVLREVDE